jgi:hypothetical protein
MISHTDCLVDDDEEDCCGGDDDDDDKSSKNMIVRLKTHIISYGSRYFDSKII